MLLKNQGYNDLAYAGDYAIHPSGGIGIRNEKIRNNPDEVFNFVKANVKGLMYYKTHRSASIEIIMDYLRVKRPLAEKIYDAHIRGVSNDGLADEKWQKAAIKFASKLLGIKRIIPPSEIYDFSFVKKALSQLK